MKLDENDKKLLNVIQEGKFCVPKVTAIAKETGLPPTTIYVRLKKMRDAGIIKGYYGLIDSDKVGQKILSCTVILPDFQHTYNSEEKLTDLKKRLLKIPEIKILYTGSADWGYFALIEVSSFAEYNKVIENKLLTLGGIDLKDYIIVERLKEDFKTSIN